MITIAVYSSKGGVGKTITAVNLSSVLAQSKRVLVIDTDGQYSLSSFFVVNTNGSTALGSAPQYNIFDVLFNDVPLTQAATSISPTLQVVASDPKMVNADRLLADEPGADLRLQKSLKTLGRKHDICIIDVPSGWGSMARNAIMACQHLLIPINSDSMAFDCAVDTITRAKRTCEAYSRKPCKVHILLTSYRETNNAREIAELCAETWPGQLLNARIRHSEKIKELSLDRATVTQRAAGTGREDYQTLATEIIGIK